MNLTHLLTVLLGVAVVCLISGAEASPHLQAPMFSPLSMQAGLRCGLVNGHIECGNTNGSGKHQDGDNDDDNHQKKNNDEDSGLSECTIQGANSGGGCKGGFKYVCEKLKSGKKCCGCVADKNAKAGAGDPVIPTTKFDCVMPGVLDYSMFASDEAEAKLKFAARLKDENLAPKGAVTCTKLQ